MANGSAEQARMQDRLVPGRCSGCMMEGRVNSRQRIWERIDKYHAVAKRDYMNEMIELNACLLDAEEQGQASELEKHLTEDFFIVRSTGQKLDRQAFLADVPKRSHLGRQSLAARGAPI